jgi:TRAP-type mannitol/chloroaromatic compound transport system permease small subunit
MTGAAGSTPSNTTWIDRLSERIGHGVAWLTLAMVGVTLIVVVLRYAFGTGRIWLQESITWMHAAVFMLGAAYALRTGDHVRVDVLYRSRTAHQRAWVDALGVLLLLWPVCGFIFIESLPYVASSFGVREASREAGGLPALYLLKAVIPLMAALLALQGLADLLRAVRTIRTPATP